MNMEVDVFTAYWNAITAIEAQEMLVEMTLHDWPKMKKNSRTELHRKIHKQAYPYLEARTITPQELARMLNGK
jgi:hypothetical protein